MDLIQKLKDQVKPLGKKIVLPEYKDERVLKATEIILKEGFVTPVLVGNPAEITEAAKAVGVSVEGAESSIQLTTIVTKKWLIHS